MSAATIYVPGTVPELYDAALEGLTALNVALLTSTPFPPLYDAGVKYRRELTERWKHAGLVMDEGHGDCEDLACWRAAEMRVSGVYPNAFVQTYQTGPRKLHAVVNCGDAAGTIEDPSVRLGMQPVNPAARIIDDPSPEVDEISEEISPDGRRARIRIPMQGGKAMVVSGDVCDVEDVGGDVMGAWYDPFARVYRTAAAVLNTPEAQALLPLKAKLAIMAARRAESVANTARKAWQGSPKKPPAAPTTKPFFTDQPTTAPSTDNLFTDQPRRAEPVRGTAAPTIEVPTETFEEVPMYPYDIDPTDPGVEMVNDNDVMGFGFGSILNVAKNLPGVRLARGVASRIPGVRNLPGVKSRGSRQPPQQDPYGGGYGDPYGYGTTAMPQDPYGYPMQPPPGYGMQPPPSFYPGQVFNPGAMPPPSYGGGYPPGYGMQPPMPQIFDVSTLPLMYGGPEMDPYGAMPPGGYNAADMALLYGQEW